jgi:uncharacterized protein
VYFVVHLTERCNLRCTYCTAGRELHPFEPDLTYDLDTLAAFLRKDPSLCLQLYGGEPLLRMDLLEGLLDRVPCRHVNLQTNGMLLHRLRPELFDRIHVVAVSLDGPREITDAARGAGTYDRVVEQVLGLRERGYTGRIDVRMTAQVGGRIHEAVTHLLHECAARFDAVYWQLNVLYSAERWKSDAAAITRWFEDVYEADLGRLLDDWLAELGQGRLRHVVPFTSLLHTLLAGEKVASLRCGAGSHMWSIGTDGAIHPCPVLRRKPELAAGHIAESHPLELASPCALGRPCTVCDLLDVCGGRCLATNRFNAWGARGFFLVCDRIRGMVDRLRAAVPEVRRLVGEGRLRLDDLLPSPIVDYEVIP